MAEGISPRLPLAIDGDDGAYALNKTYRSMAAQNLKHLILTAPGEHMMDPELGVGLRRYLFEFNGSDTYSAISSKINQQVQKYLSYIRIDDIKYQIPEGNIDLYPHNLSVSIFFTIVPLQMSTALQIDVDNN